MKKLIFVFILTYLPVTFSLTTDELFISLNQTQKQIYLEQTEPQQPQNLPTFTENLKKNSELDLKNNPFILNKNFQNKIQIPDLKKIIKMGGGDSGGGSVIVKNQNTILKDFQTSENIPMNSDFTIEKKQVSKNISTLNSANISDLIATLKIENLYFKYMLQIAAQKSLWFLVDHKLSLQNEYSRTNTDIQTAAIYKRSIGILINKNIFENLPVTHQQGLLFHETLRMLSIGFGIDLSTTDIEEITNSVFSSTHIDFKKYSKLNFIISEMLKNDLSQPDRNHSSDWIHTLQRSTNQDSDFKTDLSLDFFFSQSQFSKFSFFTKLFTEHKSIYSNLIQENFYDWIIQQPKDLCTTEVNCNYSEKWPIFQNSEMQLKKWTLLHNDNNMLIWHADDTNATIAISKVNFETSDQENFCNAISKNKKQIFNVLQNSDQQIFLLKNSTAQFVFDRADLSSMKKIKSDSNGWVSSRRPMCIHLSGEKHFNLE